MTSKSSGWSPGVGVLSHRVRQHWDDLSVSEKKVADYLLASSSTDVAFRTIRGIASQSGASTRSVLRMLRKVGYGGFPDLQAELRADIEQRLSSPISRLRRVRSDSTSHGAIAQAIADGTENLHGLTRISDSVLRGAASAIIRARGSVSVFGAGKAQAAATYLWFELILMRPRCHLLHGSELEVVDKLMDLSATDTVIVFDVRRYPRLGALVSEIARERGAHVVVFSDHQTSPAAIPAHQVLVAPVSSQSVFDSYVALFALVDVLTQICVQEMSERALASRLELYETLTDLTHSFRKDRSPRDE